MKSVLQESDDHRLSVIDEAARPSKENILEMHMAKLEIKFYWHDVLLQF